jgi:hypothetical protein
MTMMGGLDDNDVSLRIDDEVIKENVKRLPTYMIFHLCNRNSKRSTQLIHCHSM